MQTNTVAQATSTDALRVTGLSAWYGKRQVLSDVSLVVAPGEIVSVLGHNGAGKTTLLKSILGTVAQRSGAISCFGTDISAGKAHKNVHAGMSYSAAESPVFRELSVDANLKLGGYQRPKVDEEQRLHDVLAVFPKLGDRYRQAAGTLSGGEQRMLAIGMALMNKPRLMLLDEPSVGLAPATVNLILEQVRELCVTTGISVLMVDQNVRAALRVTDRVYYQRMGKMLLTETAEDSRAREQYWELF
jgi:branched-chain amino acid transport system ATP-binding protein